MPNGLDPLTGLMSRQAFLTKFSPMGDGWRSLGFLDLDLLKLINDQHGHACGDRALCLFAGEVQTALPPESVVARIGGDELAVITRLPAAELARRLDVANATLAQAEDLALSFSAGVVTLGAGDTIDRRLADADAAMYLAKHEGRARVVLHGQTTERFATERRDLFSRMARLQADNARLRSETVTDPLTGIGNRRALDRFMETAERGQPPVSRWAALFIDVDQFHDYNHRHGDEEGDQVLLAIAQILAATLRGDDDVTEAAPGEAFRKGGEEFVAIAQVPTAGDAVGLAERLRRSVEELRIPHGAPERPFVTVSVGVGVTDETTSLETARVLAGRRAFWLKENGQRNRVRAEDWDTSSEHS